VSFHSPQNWAWSHSHLKQRILVHCKPGVVHLWCPYATVFGWSGYRVLFMEAQKLSVGSSALHPVSGVQYIRCQDALIICLSGGSFHVIQQLSLEPSWSAANVSTLTTENLSVASRSVFTRVENEETQFTDVNRISGMLSYDGSATLLWLHEFVLCCRLCTELTHYHPKGLSTFRFQLQTRRAAQQ
jgi:general transcription factor 3C protein 4